MTKAKETFVDKVKTFLKLDDDSKVAKFQKEDLKLLKQQITLRGNEKEELTEKIAEKEEELTETSLDVDLESIKTLSDRKSYIDTYNSKLLGILEEIDDLEEDLETKDAEIAKFEKLIEKIS